MSYFKLKSSQIAWSCPWYQVRQDEILHPDGCATTCNVIEKPASVWIVPVTSDGNIVLIYNYRYTVDKWCWEIPAGNQITGMSIKDSAKKELKEEVGGKAGKMEYIGQFYAASGYESLSLWFFWRSQA